MQFDVIIRNGRVLDGTGAPAVRADIGIRDGRIAVISRREDELQTIAAEVELDATGLYVAPGFIDLHTHTDYSILSNPDASNALQMGVTTEGAGQCGGSAYPVTEGYRATLQGWFRLLGRGEEDIDWEDLEGWRRRVEADGSGVNIAPYVGHNALRLMAMGPEGSGGERVLPTDDELRTMKQLLAHAMEQGAFGLSTGLRYALGRNSTTDEVVALAEVAAEYGGIYISHLRSESDRLIASVQELIDISRRAQLPACISHHKASMRENWGKVSETTRMVTRAQQEGLPIFIDFYPWTHGRQANMGAAFVPYLPPRDGEDRGTPPLDDLLAALGDRDRWETIKAQAQQAFERQYAANEARKNALRPHGIDVPDLWHPAHFDHIVHSATHPELIGLSYAEVAEVLDAEDHWEAMRQVYLDDNGETSVAAGEMSKDDILTILRHPSAAISTDGWATDPLPAETSIKGITPHPRQFGTYPKVIGQFARDEGVLSLAEAVRRMTSLPASFLGLRNRGIIREGVWADLTVFDYDRICCVADYSNPTAYPEGIAYVLVNGQVAVDHGRRTGARSGRVLSNR